jgi:hypothetical protein
MKKLFLVLCAFGLALSLCNLQAASTGKKEKAAKASKRGSLVHMVAFKFKPETSAAQIKEIEQAFAALPSKIPVILSYETGTNISPEKHDKGFTHGFILTFANDKDRDAYLVHPAHQDFGKLVGPCLADVFVIDFKSAK